MILLVALLLPVEPVRLDADGVPLPPGAVARLGSALYRVPPNAPTVSPDGRVLLAFHHSRKRAAVHALDAATGRPLGRFDVPAGWEYHTHRVREPGVLAIEASRPEVGLGVFRYDRATGFPLGPVTPVAHGVDRSARLSPGGGWVTESFLDVCRRNGLDHEDQVFRVRPAAGDDPPRELVRDRDAGEHADVSFAVSPDDRRAAAADRSPAVRLFDPGTGRVEKQLDLPPGDVAGGLAFLADDRLAGWVWRRDGSRFDVGTWDVPAGRWRSLAVLETRYLSAVTPLDGGRRLAVRRDHDWLVFDATSGARVGGGPTAFGTLAFAPDGRTVYDHGHTRVRVLDAATGKPRGPDDDPGVVKRLAFLPDGRLLVAHQTGTRLWDADFRAWRPVAAAKGDHPPTSPDGRLTLVRHDADDMQVVEAITGKPRLAIPTVPGRSEPFAFAPDGRHLAAVEHIGGTVLVWDLRRVIPGVPTPLAVADLASADAEVGYRAVRVLAADPDRSLPLLRAALPPADAITGERMNRLLADLDAPRFADRQAAARAIAALGTEAGPAIRATLKATSSAEVRARLEPLVAAANANRLSADELRVERAVEAVEWMANPAADALLARWASGAAGRRLTVAATAAATRRGCAARTGAGPADR